MNKYIVATKLTYTTHLPLASDFFDLFLTTGWNKSYQLTAEELWNALQKSWYCLSVYDDNKLVGFGRILCDGTVHALLLDLIVIPEYQGQGIGNNILDKLVGECQKHNIRDVQLFSAEGKMEFYNKRGFIERPCHAPGMEYQKKK